MSNEVIWEKTLGTYQCKCVAINDFFGKLTVINKTGDLPLNKELILKQPYDYNQWEEFCRSAINNE